MNSQVRIRATIGLLAVWLAAAATLHAHPATERYIPVGKSPGISGTYSYNGVIQSHSEEAGHTLAVRSEKTGLSSISMNKDTRIYLDRSAKGRSNTKGSYSDCRPGRRIEVKFVDNDPAKPAEWIKVVVNE